ncbi:MAG: DUF4349 domain-containing protein [Chloroflexi bacterium]|nr:DUF4349 domain-containing protein [Chloroflexota bacterium]
MTTWHLPASSARVRFAAAAAVLLLIAGVACSSIVRPGANPSTSSSTVGPPSVAGVPVPGAVAGAPAASSAPVGAAPVVPAAGGAAGAQAAAAPAAARDAISSPTQAQSQTPDTTVPDTSAQLLDRMVIRTAQLTVEVQDMESALAHARAIASQAGGYVSASNTRIERQDDQDRMVADLTLQVRSDAADSAVSDLRGLGKVTSETSGSQDVTDEYVDLDSNLRNLQASETAILKLMDKATQISDVMSLQRELTNVRGQIERIQGRKTYLERRTNMATITLALRLPPLSPTAVTGGTWDPVATAVRGWQASLNLLRGIANVLIVSVAFGWWLLPLAGLGAYVFFHRRRTPIRAE